MLRLLLVIVTLGILAVPAGAERVAGFPYGQCTWFANKKRPDIYERTQAVAPVSDWNAYRWAVNARRGGLSVSGRPRRGDIVVIPRNARIDRRDGGWWQAGSVGHVALVTRASDRYFTMRGTNAGGRTIATPVTVRGLDSRGLRFIHR